MQSTDFTLRVLGRLKMPQHMAHMTYYKKYFKIKQKIKLFFWLQIPHLSMS